MKSCFASLIFVFVTMGDFAGAKSLPSPRAIYSEDNQSIVVFDENTLFWLNGQERRLIELQSTRIRRNTAYLIDGRVADPLGLSLMFTDQSVSLNYQNRKIDFAKQPDTEVSQFYADLQANKFVIQRLPDSPWMY